MSSTKIVCVHNQPIGFSIGDFIFLRSRTLLWWPEQKKKKTKNPNRIEWIPFHIKFIHESVHVCFFADVVISLLLKPSERMVPNTEGSRLMDELVDGHTRFVLCVWMKTMHCIHTRSNRIYSLNWFAIYGGVNKKLQLVMYTITKPKKLEETQNIYNT